MKSRSNVRPQGREFGLDRMRTRACAPTEVKIVESFPRISLIPIAEPSLLRGVRFFYHFRLLFYVDVRVAVK